MPKYENIQEILGPHTSLEVFCAVGCFTASIVNTVNGSTYHGLEADGKSVAEVLERLEKKVYAYLDQHGKPQ